MTPLRGSYLRTCLQPWAHAHGYIISPLRG
jgi:hypothetical protein